MSRALAESKIEEYSYMSALFASRSAKTLAATAVLGAALSLTLAACGHPTAAVSAAQPQNAKVSLTILAQKPGSSIEGPAYSPNTDITVPANAVVTVTIVNADPGDTNLPANSPFAQVKGVVNNTAYVDGVPYSSLDVTKVAHTFTIAGLGVSVPIPGDAPAGHNDITVTFSFKTGAAGTFQWQCVDPCGSGASGWEGPMATPGYMIGKVTVN